VLFCSFRSSRGKKQGRYFKGGIKADFSLDSRKFCGVAQMTSELDWINTDEHWLEDNWQG
jgi:hypothetical protein